MHRFAIVVAAIGLAACSNEAEVPAAQTEPVEMTAGSYDVTLADGSRMMSMLASNGTYTDTVSGAVVSTGAWEHRDDGSTCFTPSEGSAEAPTCMTTSAPDANGTFTATPDNGEPVKIKKIN